MWGRLSRRLLLGAFFSFLVLVFAPIFFWAVEHGKSDDVHSIGDAYGWLFRTLFENTSPYKIKTQFGFVSYWIVRVAGVSLVAFTTATIASRFVATVIKRGAGMGKFKGSEHLLICGWSPKGAEIIRELRAKEVEDPRPIVILADIETDPMDEKGITFVRGQPEQRRGPRARRPRSRRRPSSCSPTTRTRATTPTTSTRARSSRPSRSSRSTAARTRASRS